MRKSKFIFSVFLINVSVFGTLKAEKCNDQMLESGLCKKYDDCSELYLLNKVNLCQSSKTGEWICCPEDAPIKIPTQRPLPKPNEETNIRANFPDNENENKLKEEEILLKPPKCGVSLTDRVAHAVNTGIDEYNWMVLLRYRFPNGTIYLDCGGSLINKRWIVTAAHCITHSGSKTLAGVRLREWDKENNPDYEVDERGVYHTAPPHIDAEIDLIKIHPNFSESFRNDIALLRLKQSVTFSDSFTPICLPLEERDNSLVNYTVTIAGWGYTEYSTQKSRFKKKAELVIWDMSICETNYRKLYSNLHFSDRQICALGKNFADACKGDSGGPLMVEGALDHKRQSYTYLAGVVSLGLNGCGGTKTVPGVYTRVGAYISWLEEVMKSNN